MRNRAEWWGNAGMEASGARQVAWRRSRWGAETVGRSGLGSNCRAFSRLQTHFK